MRRARLAMVAILTGASVAAQTAVLECVADTVVRGVNRGPIMQLHPASLVLLDFRFSAVEGWQIREAKLMLHVAEGDVPAKVEVAVVAEGWWESRPYEQPRLARRQSLAVMKHEQGWISLEVPPALVTPTVRRQAHGIGIRVPLRRGMISLHSRESLSWAPYLIVSGAAPVQKAGAGTFLLPGVSIEATDRRVW